MTQINIDEVVCSADILADVLSLDKRRIQQLAKEGIIPKAQRGSYQLATAVNGYVLYLRQAEGGGQTASEYQSARTQRMKAQAMMTEMAVRRQREELVPAELIETIWQALVERFTERLLTMADRLVPRLIRCATKPMSLGLSSILIASKRQLV